MEEIPESLKQLNREKVKRAGNGVLGFFVKRIRVTILLAIGLAIWGAFSGLGLPREANPEVKVPFAAVSTIFPGASPTDVEELVTDKVEEKVKNVPNVKLVSSSSQQSSSLVSIEFEASADLDKSIADLKDAVDTVTGLPNDAEDPRVIELNFNDTDIATFSLLGNLTDEEFRQLGEHVQDELEAISGVSGVRLVGVRPRVIEVNISPAEIERFHVSINQIVGAIQAAGVNLPLGNVEIDQTQYNVRTGGKYKSAKDLETLVVSQGPSGPVLLRDVASIQEVLQEAKSISQISIDGKDPVPAISLSIRKRTGSNIIDIVDSAKARLDELKADSEIPSSVDIIVTNDLSQFIRDDFNTLGNSGLQTMIIILILLTIALSFRKAMVATLGIPLIFLMSLGIISLTGGTLNSLTLFSLVLSLGLLVDTIIVIVEGIQDGLHQGFGPFESALYSLETYKWPVLAGVLTTIAAFVPMFLVSGILGEFLKTLPITVSAALGSSLFIALFVMPGIAALIVSRFGSQNQVAKRSLLERKWIIPLKNYYRKVINDLTLSRKKKWRFMLTLVGLLIISIGVVASGFVPVELFPKTDVDFLYINFELPAGTPLAKTEQFAHQIENKLREVPDIANFVTCIGVPATDFGDISISSTNAPENEGQIVLNLKDESERRKSYVLAVVLRNELSNISGGKISVLEASEGPPTGAPVEVRVTGDDLNAVSQVANQLKDVIADIPRTIDVKTDESITPPELSFILDQEQLGRFGLTAATVSSSLRTALSGVTTGSINIEGDDVDIIVALSNNDLKNPEELLNLSIVSPTGQTVKLAQVAKLKVTPALETIRHRDTKRLVNIRADVEGTSSSAVQTEFEQRLADISLPAGVNVDFGGEVEDIQQSFTELWYSMIVAVILILFIMVLQFDSFKQPFIIMLALPLAVIGVMFGTLLFDLAFSFSTFLGVVALAGIVVNDAIILIDRINYNVKIRKLSIRESVTEAGEARLQPIIMTTLTTIAGVAPLAFANEFWRGLSVAVAFGIAFATILTLVMVPILYMKFEGKRWLRQQAGQS